MVQVDKLASSKLNWRLPNSKSIYFNNPVFTSILSNTSTAKGGFYN